MEKSGLELYDLLNVYLNFVFFFYMDVKLNYGLLKVEL